MTDTLPQYNFTEVDFDPFEENREIEKIVTINEPQREIWLSCAMGGEAANLAYNESISLDLKGEFNFEYFKQAFTKVVQRHEALRSSVSENGESLIIYKDINFTFELDDLSISLKPQNTVNEFVQAQMAKPFNLQKGPLFKVFVHKLANDHHYFTLIIHHLVGDGWSLGVIAEHLSLVYNAYIAGLPPVLNDGPQISTYAEEQAQFYNSEEFKQVENFWLDIYKDNVPVLDFPVDNPRPSTRTYESKRFDQKFSHELIEQIKLTGAKAGCSLVNTLLSAFEIFLYQQTKQNDIVVGLPTAGQAATGNFELVGHCVNLLPLRTFIDPKTSFTDYLKIRKTVFLDKQDHQMFSFGQLIQKLNLKRDPSRIPLVPIVFNVDMGMSNAVDFTGLTYKLISNPRVCETFEIFLNITGSKDDFTLEWSYNTNLFKDATIADLSDQFKQLVIKLTCNPLVTAEELLTEGESKWKLQLAKWNETDVDYPKSSNIFTLINNAAVKYPNKVAISFKEETLTYARLVELSDKLAGYLVSKNVKTGDIIGLVADRSIEMLVSLIGILKAGAAYLPIDPEYPADRIAFMLDDARTKLVLVSKAHSGQFNKNITELIIEDTWPEIIKAETKKPAVAVTGDDLAYVLYTSGSTGKPKGVQIKHHNMINFLASLQEKPGISSNDRMLALTTISFDVAGMEIFLPLANGAEIILSEREAAKDAQMLIDIIEEKKVTIMSATPSSWLMLVDSAWVKKYPIKVWTAGEALSKELADALLQRCDELWNLYGPTETTVISILKQIHATDDVITIGWPINNTQIYICDEQNQPVQQGKIGEILIGGDGVAEGYLNRPELTSERFIPDIFSQKPGATLYKTGDLGKFGNNGDIQYLGRADNQIKIRGFRIEPGEIETILAAQQNIKQALVIAREDNPTDIRLVAYVLLKQPTTDTKALIDDWKEALKAALPSFMVPSAFVILDAYPLTPNNKVDKKALPKPQYVSTHNGQSVVPKTKNEELVAAIWSTLLDIKDINIDDDFFEIGGHSMLAVKMMGEIQKATGQRFPLSILLKNSTVAKLANRIQSAEDEEESWETLVPIKTSGTKTPIYLIHGGGLNILLFKSISKYFDDDQPVYGLQAYGLFNDTDIPKTIEEAASRHIVELLKSNPNGPYALAGYSLGGYIAFEMAKQLKAMGKEIKLLGVIDTYAGSDMSKLDTLDRASKKIVRQFHKIPFFARSFFNNPAETINYQLLILKRKLQTTFSPDLVISKEVLTPREMDIYKIYDNAYDTYVLTPVDLPIVLFRVQKRLYYLDDMVYLGWDKLTTQGIKTYEVPGDHKTFLYAPNDEKFARVMQSVLSSTDN
jgi:amino acid adenylation domain-containing protein